MQEVANADVKSRLLQPFLCYLRDTYGSQTLVDILQRVGLVPDDVLRRECWLSLDQFTAILEQGRALFRDDHEFEQACVYRFRQSFGPLVLLLYATSLERSCRLGVTSTHMFVKCGRYEILDSGPSYLRLQFTNTKPETRLVCLSRQAYLRATPTLVGLPPAALVEESCIANGDDACRYVVHWPARPRWRTVALGVGAGALAVAGWLFILGTPWSPLHLVVPALGGTIGLLWEHRRAHRINFDGLAEVSEGLRQVAEHATEAQGEVLALTQRQEQWGHLMEAAVEERTLKLQEVMRQVSRLAEQRVLDIRGISHDLRNPLGVLLGYVSMLQVQTDDEDIRTLAREMEVSVNRVHELLGEVLEAASTDVALLAHAPERHPTREVAAQLQRRLKALVLGRDIRVSSLVTREAPEEMEFDVLLFDRVVDNLLTNAAKYTEQGSIVVEIGGVPEMVCLKVSDTGQGIATEKIEEIFRGQGLHLGHRRPGSYGVGLASTVRLLASVGGRLEVMSRPAVGTTFWAYLPREWPQDPGLLSARGSVPFNDLVDNVVTIRKGA